jgi:protocatechuate 3,4-dioxygenase beta subunit
MRLASTQEAIPSPRRSMGELRMIVELAERCGRARAPAQGVLTTPNPTGRPRRPPLKPELAIPQPTAGYRTDEPRHRIHAAGPQPAPAGLDADLQVDALRSPRIPLWSLQNSSRRSRGRRFGRTSSGPLDNDLILNYAKEGERSASASSCTATCATRRARHPNTLVEVWQANAGGRYRHVNDRYLAPIDPNFGGCGRMLTTRRAITLPHREARRLSVPQLRESWRPAHIHFSVFGSASPAAHHPDVFRGRPLIPTTCMTDDPGSRGAMRARRAPRSRRGDPRSTASPTASTSSCAAAADPVREQAQGT